MRSILLAAFLGALGVAAAWSCREAPKAREPASASGPDLAVVPTATVAPDASSVAPASLGRPPRPAVPPGVLSRAAEARALERAPVCPPTPRPDAAQCVPGPRDEVEIDWESARDQ